MSPFFLAVVATLLVNLPFRWAALPVFVAAYFGGQFLGSRWRLRPPASPGRPPSPP